MYSQVIFLTDGIGRTPPKPQDEIRVGMMMNVGINECVTCNAPITIQCSHCMGGDI